MKTKLFILSVIFLMCRPLALMSQINTLSTGLVASTGTRGITFNVTAINAITLTNVGTACGAGMLTSVEVWYNKSAVNGAPEISTGNGWRLVGRIPFMNIVNGSPAITSIPIPVNVVIPQGETYGFYICCASGTISNRPFTIAATDFSDANATIRTGSGMGFSGAWPNPTTTISQFAGSIKYFVNSAPMPNPVADFFPSMPSPTSPVVDTVWMNNTYYFWAAGSNSTRNYWRLPGTSPLLPGYTSQAVQFETETYIDTAKYDKYFRYTFTSPGLKAVKILSIHESNRQFKRDSITKYVYVDTPSTKPVANFLANKGIVGIGDYAAIQDLTLNGPNQWYWTFSPQCNLCTIPPYFNNFFTSSTAHNPSFFIGDPGTFTICLWVSNLRGIDTICKTEYIKGYNSYNLCSGSSMSTITESNGAMFAAGGPGLNYTRSQLIGCPGTSIEPCGDSIYVYFDRLKLLPSDSLVFRNGNSATAPIIAKVGGSSIYDLPLPILRGISSGSSMFIQIVTGTQAIPSPYDSAGFSLYWRVKPPSYGAPVSVIVLPDTIYSGQAVLFSNASTGVKMKYSWDSDGNGTSDSTSATFTKSFSISTPITRSICLATYNCVGSTNSCKNVRFMPITVKPTANFDVDKVMGFNSDTFYFKDKSINGATCWKWTFTPGSVQFLQGTSSTSQNPVVRFTNSGAYTVKLVACNSMGSDSLIRTSYVTIVAYSNGACLNDISMSDGSIAISRVVLLNGIDTMTSPTTPCYEFVQGAQAAKLYRGKKHAVTVFRTAVTSAMDRKVWIDFNMDGTFSSNEQVMNELNASTYNRTDSFMISNTQPLGKARMRVGVTIGGSSLNSNLTFLGLFKDYVITFPDDKVKPTITLGGNSTMNTQVHVAYSEPGVVAWDNIEGDISSRCVVLGTVDTSKTGINILRYYVTDLYGNCSDTITRTVFVVLNMGTPIITLTNPLNQYVEVYHSYVDPGWIAKSNSGVDISSYVVVTSNVDTALIGNYTRTYVVNDGFGTATNLRTVVVGDTTKPVLHFPPGNIYNHHVGTLLDMSKVYTVTDNYWDISKIQVYYMGTVDVNNLGIYQVCFDAVDGSNNVSPTICASVKVGDFKPPVISLKGTDPMMVEVFKGFIDPGFLVADNYWSPGTISVLIKGTVNTNKLGSYYIWYVATDPSGNKDSIRREVRVVDLTKPTINLLGVVEVNWNRNIQYVDPPIALDDNYNTDTEMRPFLVISPDYSKMPPPYVAGNRTVHYTVKDVSGNTSLDYTRTIHFYIPTFVEALPDARDFVKVYPNPSTGLVYVQLAEPMPDDAEVQLTDITGKQITGMKIAAGSAKAEELDLRELPPGFYMLRISSGDKVLMKKIQLSE